MTHLILSRTKALSKRLGEHNIDQYGPNMGILSAVNQLPQLTPCGSIWINPSQCHHFSLWLLRFFAFLRLLFFNVRHLSKRLQETISQAIWGRRMPRCIGSSCILNLLNQINCLEVLVLPKNPSPFFVKSSVPLRGAVNSNPQSPCHFRVHSVEKN